MVRKSIVRSIACLALALGLPVYAALIDGEELLDPTRPYGVEEVMQTSDLSVRVPVRYAVEFIRAGGDAPIAVINGNQVEIGTIVDGALVLDIARDYVTLTIDGEETQVRLGEGVTKTRVDRQ